MGLKEHESVFCYVNSVFSPALDEGVGNLYRVSFFFFPTLLNPSSGAWDTDHILKCFKIGEELVVHYAIHPAFG